MKRILAKAELMKGRSRCNVIWVGPAFAELSGRVRYAFNFKYPFMQGTPQHCTTRKQCFYTPRAEDVSTMVMKVSSLRQVQQSAQQDSLPGLLEAEVLLLFAPETAQATVG